LLSSPFTPTEQLAKNETVKEWFLISQMKWVFLAARRCASARDKKSSLTPARLSSIEPAKPQRELDRINRINWIFGPYVLEQIIPRILSILSIEILFVLCER
jgi:hypothetical protein